MLEDRRTAKGRELAIRRKGVTFFASPGRKMIARS
jgi:hypothetical protein